jgi:hypothetical protein
MLSANGITLIGVIPFPLRREAIRYCRRSGLFSRTPLVTLSVEAAVAEADAGGALDGLALSALFSVSGFCAMTFSVSATSGGRKVGFLVHRTD